MEPVLGRQWLHSPATHTRLSEELPSRESRHCLAGVWWVPRRTVKTDADPGDSLLALGFSWELWVLCLVG